VFEKLFQPKYFVPKGALNKEDMAIWEEDKKLAQIIWGERFKGDNIISLGSGVKAITEAQHAFPGMAAGAQWSFAQHYGFLRGCLVSLQIPFIEVSPQKWMSYFGLKKSKEEDKRTYKKRILQKAQNLYPQSSVALQTADSLMLCEFLRLTDNRN
jgi:hypothetical protein